MYRHLRAIPNGMGNLPRGTEGIDDHQSNNRQGRCGKCISYKYKDMVERILSAIPGKPKPCLFLQTTVAIKALFDEVCSLFVQ